MNKKLLLGALLVCGMGATITSCVDDTESASVTALRNAKTEQLKAVADYNKALAEAAITTANATKAAQEAIAAYNQAQADYKNAQTEWERQEAEQRLKTAEADYQQQLDNLETQKLQNELTRANLKKQLAAAIASADSEKIGRLNVLLQNYNNASDELIRTQNSLAQQRIQLAKAEAGLISTRELIEENIADLEDANAEKQASILEKQAYIDTWSKYTSATPEQLAEARQKEIDAEKAKDAADEAKQKAINAKSNANANMVASEYMNAMSDILATSGDFDVDINIVWPGNGAPLEALYTYSVVVNGDNNKVTYIPLFMTPNNPKASAKEYIKYTLDGENLSLQYEQLNSNYNVIGDGLAQYVKIAEDYVAVGATKDVADAQKKYDDAVKAQAAAQAAYDKAVAAQGALKTAQDALAAANKVVADAGDKATEEQKKAAQDAQTAVTNAQADLNKALTKADGTVTDIDGLKADIDSAERNANRLLADLNNAKQIEADAQDNLADLKNSVKVVTDNAEQNEANIKAYNEAAKAEAQAIVDANIAYSDLTVAQSEYSALKALGSQDNNDEFVAQQISAYEKEISDLKKEIADNEASIAKYQKQLEEGDNDQLDNQAAIEEAKNEIARLEAQIPALEKAVELAKNALDAALEAE